ncbi:MAG: hypothetical protein HQM09_09140 [Candidatus Riflebacteria bacterium]|nr:hypothetical protein [Candidatus Riflebacteria bacterium]
MITGKRNLRIISLFTAIFFMFSTIVASAQNTSPQAPISAAQIISGLNHLAPVDPSKLNAGVNGAPVDPSQLLSGLNIPGVNLSGVNIPAILAANPQFQGLTGNLAVMESSLQNIERLSIPLYNKIAPSNMEAMNIAERIKAVVGNTQTLVKQGMQTYGGQVGKWNDANGVTPDTTFEAELGIGLNKLGVQTAKMPLGGAGDAVVTKLKVIVDAIKASLTEVIRIVRAKIASIAQKVGLMKKDETGEEKNPTKETTGSQISGGAAQNSDNAFINKLTKGIDEGTKSAKQSLKSSFSFSNLAVTTTVAVGTNLALQVINGEKPSFGQAAKAVASLEFAGSVAGSALGAAGGQFTATLVRSFIPGPVGALVGAVIPVMFASAGGQMGSSLAGGIKNKQFSISKAIKSVDPVDLIGSSLGSTIGMMIGAPIPILGPIIGGIVGGVIGGKVAKWIVGCFKSKPKVNTGTVVNANSPNNGISIGDAQLNVADGTQGALAPAEPVSAPVAVSGDVTSVERKYYETYLKYNRLVEQGKTDEAQKLFGELKTYSDQYNALKQAKPATK